MHDKSRILFLGDVVGLPGRALVKKYLTQLREELSPDIIVINGENAAQDGRGITPAIADFFKRLGADVVTTGNHVWAKREIAPFAAQSKWLLRPLNFPAGCPGVGYTIIRSSSGAPVAVVNVQGRVFMRELVSCPFRALESILSFLQQQVKIIFVDFHGETTAEKRAFVGYFAGKVSAVIGTHTHVQTADEQIIRRTAFLTDVGMVGPLDSVIGVKEELIIRNMLTQMPEKFVVETEGPMVLGAVVIDCDNTTGEALSIERIRIVDTEPLNLLDADLKDK